MCSKSKLLILVIGIIFAATGVMAQEQWLEKARFGVEATGTAEVVLPPEAHRLISLKGSLHGQPLDLSLVGPDGNTRAFELYWREAGSLTVQNLVAQAKIKLLEDNRLLIESEADKAFLIERIEIKTASNIGKADLEVFQSGQWNKIETNIAIQKLGNKGILKFKTDELQAEKLRISISGYDNKFAQAPVFVESFKLYGKPSGKDYFYQSYPLNFETAKREKFFDLKVALPGSGVFIDSLEVTTKALFKGDWKIGTEEIRFGSKSFLPMLQGLAELTDSVPPAFNIDVKQRWDAKTLIIRLKSDEYFGEVIGVKAKLRLPRLIFVADTVGEYQIITGLNKETPIVSKPSLSASETLFVKANKEVERNTSYQKEKFLKNYSLKGGPFKGEGFTWKTELKVPQAGFYRLELSPKANMLGNFHSLRIVDGQSQVPYFFSQTELRKQKIVPAHELDQEKNISIYSIPVPAGKNKPEFIRLKVSGVFDRKIELKRHFIGQVGWQNWKNFDWVNSKDSESFYDCSLWGLEPDVKEFQLLVCNGNNTPLKIENFEFFYKARDLFFVADKAGSFELYGGSKKAIIPNYDLHLIQEQLAEFVPTTVKHGDIQPIKKDIAAVGASVIAAGALFDPSGYTWKSTIDVQNPGLIRVQLNEKASLDNFRDSIRIVKDKRQIPFFTGQKRYFFREIKVTPEYKQSENTTYLTFELPASSLFWRLIRIHAKGIFTRNAEVQIKKPGKLGWQKWFSKEWKGEFPEGKNAFAFSIQGFEGKETEFRIVIPHGDNSELKIDKLEAEYSTFELFFKTKEAGIYEIYGGNDEVAKPNYDLAMVRNQLLKTEPNTVEMSEIQKPDSPPIKQKVKRAMKEAFSEKGWGLYVVMGLITLLLVIIIIKIFPEPHSETGEDK